MENEDVKPGDFIFSQRKWVEPKTGDVREMRLRVFVNAEGPRIESTINIAGLSVEHALQVASHFMAQANLMVASVLRDSPREGISAERVQRQFELLLGRAKERLLQREAEIAAQYRQKRQRRDTREDD